MLKSFREYLEKNSDILLEMARYSSQPRFPVNLDRDDIDFLKQFKYDDQKIALSQRYEYLFEALKSLHQRRKKFGMEDLEKNIENALKIEISNLKDNIVAKESREFKNLYSKNTDSNIRMNKEEMLSLRNRVIEILKNKGKITDKDIKEEAERIAYDHARSVINSLPASEDERKPFKLGKSKKLVIWAKPYLNRLYHKLERTVGEEHVDEQIKKFLGNIGKYGFDLSEPQETEIEDDTQTDDESEPKKGKKVKVLTTRGMRFPVHENNKKRLNKYQGLLAHRIFGEIPNDAYWIKVDEPRKDTLTREHALEPKIKKFYRILGESQSKPKSDRERRNLAKKMAEAELYKEIQKGKKILGPKYPLKDPQTGESKGFYQGELKGSTSNLDSPDQKIEWYDPDLYLPHTKQYYCPNPQCRRSLNKKEANQLDSGNTVKCNKCNTLISRDGQANTTKARFNFVPYMKEASFYRRLTRSDFNIETDENGNIIKKTLKPEIRSTTAIITTVLQGVNAEKIKEILSNPIANSIKSIEGIEDVQIEDMDGVSKVSVRLSLEQNKEQKANTLNQIEIRLKQLKPQLPNEAESKVEVKEINKLTGHDKTWILVGDEEFKYGEEHKKGGAFDFNQNTKERQYANKLNPEYQKLLSGYLDELSKDIVTVVGFGKRAMISSAPPKSGENPYYGDFARGILNGRGRGGPGAPIYLINDRDTFDDLYNLVYFQMLDDLYNHKRWGTSQARKTAAATTTGNFLQFAHPGHAASRRRRTIGTEYAHRNTTVTGADGREQLISDPNSDQRGLDANLRTKNIIDLRAAQTARGKGGRIIQFGKDGFYNNLQNMRNYYDLRAKDSDQKLNSSKEMVGNSVQTMEEKLKLLGSAKIEQAEVEQGIIDMFTMLGIYDAEAAKRQVDGWKEDQYTASQMLQAFNDHPLVKEKLALAQQGNLQPKPIVVDAPEQIVDTPEQPKTIAKQEAKPRNVGIKGFAPSTAKKLKPEDIAKVNQGFDKFKIAYDRQIEKDPSAAKNIGALIAANIELTDPDAVKSLQNKIDAYVSSTDAYVEPTAPKAVGESNVLEKINLILSRSQDLTYLKEASELEIKAIHYNLLKIPESIYALQKKKAILEISKIMKSRGI